MKRKRFTEEQIVGVLREHEAGAKAADLARKHSVSETTPYNWKAQYGGMNVSDAKRLKPHGDENAKPLRICKPSWACRSVGPVPSSAPGRRVARELTDLITRRGRPDMIVSDHGTEFTSYAMLAWSKDHRVEWHYIAPGKPMRNS